MYLDCTSHVLRFRTVTEIIRKENKMLNARPSRLRRRTLLTSTALATLSMSLVQTSPTFASHDLYGEDCEESNYPADTSLFSPPFHSGEQIPVSIPTGITAGNDGNMYFVEHAGDRIARMNTNGVTTAEFPVPGAEPAVQGRFLAGDGPFHIIQSNLDGNLWFTEMFTDGIGRLDPATGVITEFLLPGRRLESGHLPIENHRAPLDIIDGPDGALWFSENFADKIGRITTSGVITEYTIPTAGAGPAGMTVGPDGAIWFSETNTDKIGRITTAGVIDEFTLPPDPDGFHRPEGIVTGPDGNLWFTEHDLSRIGRMTPAGVYLGGIPTPTPAAGPTAMIVGPDCALWFPEEFASRIGRIDASGTITEFITPSPTHPVSISDGPGGTLWFGTVPQGPPFPRPPEKIGRMSFQSTTG